MRKISLILMLIIGFGSLTANDPEGDNFESFTAHLNRADQREFDNTLGKSLEDTYYSIYLVAAAQIIANPFIALYNHKEMFPAQASFVESVQMIHCMNSRVMFQAQLYKANDDEVKRDQIIQNFKNEYERCLSIANSIKAKIDSNKK